MEPGPYPRLHASPLPQPERGNVKGGGRGGGMDSCGGGGEGGARDPDTLIAWHGAAP